VILDIVFQFGKFFTGDNNSSLLGYLIPVFCVILTAFFSWLFIRYQLRHDQKKWIKELRITEVRRQQDRQHRFDEAKNSELKLANNKLKNFLSLCHSVINLTKLQISVCNQYLMEINAKPTNDHKLKFVLNIDIQRILSINFESLRDSFFYIYQDKQEQRDLFKKIYYAIDYIHNVTEEIKRIDEVVQNESYQTKLEYKRNILIFGDGFYRIGLRLRKESLGYYKQDILYITIENILYSYHRNLSSNRTETDYPYNHLIRPAQEQLHAILLDSEAQALLELAERITLLRTDIIDMAQHLVSELEPYIYSIEKQMKILNKAVTGIEIQNCKWKPYVKSNSIYQL
jgi:hypothetical protein